MAIGSTLGITLSDIFLITFSVVPGAITSVMTTAVTARQQLSIQLDLTMPVMQIQTLLLRQ